MKKLLLLILPLFIITSLFSQSYNNIYGKQDFKDSVKLSKNRNNAAGNYILSTDTLGRIIKVLNPNGSNACQTRLIDGSVIWVSGFNFSNTKLTYQIGCQLDTASASNFSITAADTSDRYTIVWADTLGNIGTTDGTVGAVASIPTVNPSSQILLATYLIPANSTEPALLSNTGVYKENVEWTGTSTVVGYSGIYATLPYEGLYSFRVPAYVGSAYNNWTDGSDHSLDTMSFASFYIKLATPFVSPNYMVIAFSNSIGMIKAAVIASGQYGLNGNLLNQWQVVSFPISALNSIQSTNVFNTFEIDLIGTSSGAIGFDNIILQAGGNNQSTSGVQSYNGQTNHISSSYQINADSSYVVHIVNGIRTDSFRILRTVARAGTNMTIDMVGDTAVFNATGGGTDTALIRTIASDSSQWVKNGTDIYNKNTGKVGIGTPTPNAKIDILSTATQLQLSYDGSNYIGFGAMSNADLRFYTNGNQRGTFSNGRWYGQQYGEYDLTTFGGNDYPNHGMGIDGSNGDVTLITGAGGTRVRVKSATGNVLIGTPTDIPSSLLTLGSTTKGLLIPRMTATQMNAISSPAIGLMIWNTTDSTLFEYRGTFGGWSALGGGSGSTERFGLEDDTATSFRNFALNNNAFNFSLGSDITYGDSYVTFDAASPAFGKRFIVQMVDTTNGNSNSIVADKNNARLQSGSNYVAASAYEAIINGDNASISAYTDNVEVFAKNTAITSTTGGLLIPRMTAAQRIAISSPANGLMVYDTDASAFYYYAVSAWTLIGGGTTSYQTETASGATTFTFTSVPSSYDDYIIFVNGAAIRPTTDYTTSGNIVTISTIVSGDVVRFQRVK